MNKTNGEQIQKVYISSNGCDRRLLDSQKISDFFQNEKHLIVKNPSEADFIFINTCAMSQTAEDTSVNLIKRHLNYNGKIVVHGCLPQIAPSRIENEFFKKEIIKIDAKDLDKSMDEIFPEVNQKFSETPDPIVLARDQNFLSKVLNKIKFDKIFYLTCLAAFKFKIKNLNQPLHPRIKKGAYLQIGSGCSDNCTYCAIPRAIGPMKSKSTDQVLREYARILEKGESDFVFTSDNLGLYGLEIGTNLMNLFDEMARIDAYYRKVYWTINELHPKWLIRFCDQLVKHVELGKIKELCIPIQSGNDRILELMKRHNKVQLTTDSLLKIRQVGPKLRLTTDVIIGFPTETDDEFLDTIKMIVKVRFDQVMFFSFGKREGTEAGRYEFDENENKENIIRRFKMAMKLLDQEKISYTFQ